MRKPLVADSTALKKTTRHFAALQTAPALHPGDLIGMRITPLNNPCEDQGWFFPPIVWWEKALQSLSPAVRFPLRLRLKSFPPPPTELWFGR